jgi:hypothetical protein
LYNTSIDTGATTHAYTLENTGIKEKMIFANLPFHNITKTTNGITVMYPDGNTDTSTYTAILDNLPSIPTKFKKVHLFNKLASGALLSLG